MSRATSNTGLEPGCTSPRRSAMLLEIASISLATSAKSIRASGGFSGTRIEPQGAAGETLGVEITQHEVGVGDRRARAPERVARGPRHRAGALGAHLYDADRGHCGDAAAAGADFDHVDGGCRDR